MTAARLEHEVYLSLRTEVHRNHWANRAVLLTRIVDG